MNAVTAMLLPRDRPSPNCDARPLTDDLSLIVVHAISLPPERFGGDGVEQLFTNTLDPGAHPYYAQIHQLRVSAHYFIRRRGELIRFVDPTLRAWHAGASLWQGCERCNDFSIGIELEGCDTLPFEAAQYRVLAELLADLCASFPVTDIVGHSDIAPGRKTDPGPFFSWSMLREALQQAGQARVAALLRPQGGPEGLGCWPFPLAERP
jgi:AmpD protein